MQIHTARMVLRPVEETDCAAFVSYYAGREEHWRPWMPRMVAESYEVWFASSLERSRVGWRDGGAYRFVGVLPDGTIATMINLSNVVRLSFQNADAGWGVRGDLQGRGFAREGLIAVLNAAFRSESEGGLGLHRVQAAIIPRNERSLALAGRVGFRREGLALRMIELNGVWEDHLIFAKLADEQSAEGERREP